MMGTEPKHRDWVKLWVKEALLGTIREDLTPEERGTWYDYLLLAGNSRIPGVICANQNTALPNKRIAGILNIPETLVRRCTKKFKDSGRILVDKNGVISIVNWSRYQYSDYDRQKPYRQKKSILERNQQRLKEHPDEVHGSLENPDGITHETYGFATREEWLEDEKKNLVDPGTPLEVHEKALEKAILKRNPHALDSLPE